MCTKSILSKQEKKINFQKYSLLFYDTNYAGANFVLDCIIKDLHARASIKNNHA